MKIACLCPTYNRPELLTNSLALFNAQTHPDKKLFILDDAGQYHGHQSETLRIVSTGNRYQSLPQKYLTLQAMANEWKPDAIAFWDDDDIYLPHHLSSIALQLGCEYQWTAPTNVWSTYTGRPVLEDATGRFWASSAIRWEAFRDVGGVPITHRGDFDQMFLGNCRAKFGPPVSLATTEREATFVFRWNDTLVPHAQHYLRSPDDVTWYYRMKLEQPAPFVGELVAKYDANCLVTLGQIDEILAHPFM